MNQAFIFDFDATLADSLQLILKAVRRLAGKYTEKKLTDAEINLLRDKRIQDTVRHLRIPMYKIPFFASELKKSLRFDYERVKPIQGMKETIEELKSKGNIVGILTSNSSENVEKFLNANKIELFDFIYTGSSMFGKGSVLKKAMTQHKLDAKNVFYIGDETRDIDAAKEARAHSVAVSWGINTKGILERQNPDFIIDTPQELLTKVAR